jgi:hypothetical protein
MPAVAVALDAVAAIAHVVAIAVVVAIAFVVAVDIVAVVASRHRFVVSRHVHPVVHPVVPRLTAQVARSRHVEP